VINTFACLSNQYDTPSHKEAVDHCIQGGVLIV